MQQEQLLIELNKKSALRSKESFNTAVSDWTLPQWGNATAGEVGEMCNIIKKIDLGKQSHTRDGIPLYEALSLEIGDVAIYLDLLAQRAGLNLTNCIVKSFNKKSIKIGSSYLLLELPEYYDLNDNSHNRYGREPHSMYFDGLEGLPTQAEELNDDLPF